MVFNIHQKELSNLLKGAFAATFKNKTNLNSTVSQFIRISVENGDSLKIESFNDLFSSYCFEKKDLKNELKIEKNGSCLVNAFDFSNWVSSQKNNSLIKISLENTEIESVNIENNENTTEDLNNQCYINKIGILNLFSFAEENQTTWSLDAFDSKYIPDFQFQNQEDFLLSIKCKNLLSYLKQVSFASLKKDEFNNILDCISIQFIDNEIYFMTTDKTQCSIVQILNDNDFNKNNKNNFNVLINNNVIQNIIKNFSVNENINFFYSKNKNKLFLNQENLTFSISMLNSNAIDNYISVNVLLKKQYEKITSISKSDFISLFKSASLVNEKSVLLCFSHEENSLISKSMNYSGKKPLINKIKLINLEKTCFFICNPSLLLKALNYFKDEKINIYYSNRVLKISTDEDLNFNYYSILFNDPIYA